MNFPLIFPAFQFCYNVKRIRNVHNIDFQPDRVNILFDFFQYRASLN